MDFKWIVTAEEDRGLASFVACGYGSADESTNRTCLKKIEVVGFAVDMNILNNRSFSVKL